ncbi:MAG: hypothetical protein VX043_03875, partial [Candidatus Thermoplasmatota archaeon]|nr:hypothetical protein [Candidatus Thermoplasmatota archaeon]
INWFIIKDLTSCSEVLYDDEPVCQSKYLVQQINLYIIGAYYPPNAHDKHRLRRVRDMVSQW